MTNEERNGLATGLEALCEARIPEYKTKGVYKALCEKDHTDKFGVTTLSAEEETIFKKIGYHIEVFMKDPTEQNLWDLRGVLLALAIMQPKKFEVFSGVAVGDMQAYFDRVK